MGGRRPAGANHLVVGRIECRLPFSVTTAGGDSDPKQAVSDDRGCLAAWQSSAVLSTESAFARPTSLQILGTVWGLCDEEL